GVVAGLPVVRLVGELLPGTTGPWQRRRRLLGSGERVPADRFGRGGSLGLVLGELVGQVGVVGGVVVGRPAVGGAVAVRTHVGGPGLFPRGRAPEVLWCPGGRDPAQRHRDPDD